MLKKASGVVLASLRGSTYPRFASSLTAALPEDLFEHLFETERDRRLITINKTRTA